MKFGALILSGVFRWPARAILMALSLVNAFLLFGLLIAFSTGMASAGREANADILMTFSRLGRHTLLPMPLAASIAGVDGVRAVSPILTLGARFGPDAREVRAYAITPASVPAITPSMLISPDQITAFQQTRDGALVNDALAQTFGWKVGDRVPLSSNLWQNRDGSNTWNVKIVGVFKAGQSALLSNSLFTNIDFIDQARTRRTGTANGMVVRVTDPAMTGPVAAAIDNLNANSSHETRTAAESQLAQTAVAFLGDVTLLVRIIVGSILVALLLSLLAVMAQSARQRANDFGVLKTLGFRKRTLILLAGGESLLLCCVSAGIGLALAVLLFPYAARAVGYPHLPPGAALAPGAMLALILGLICAVPGALAAAAARPAGSRS